VCSAANVGLVRSLGAHDAIDYATEDVRQSGRRFDLILDTVNPITVSDSHRLLTPSGRMLMVAASLPAMMRAATCSFSARKDHARVDTGCKGGSLVLRRP